MQVCMAITGFCGSQFAISVINLLMIGNVLHVDLHGPRTAKPMPLDDDLLHRAQQQFAKRVRELREIQGMSQEDVARAGGIDQGWLSKVEDNKVNPRLTSLLKVQHGLGVDSLEALLGRIPSATMTGRP